MIIFLFLFGPLFTPKWSTHTPNESTITIMSYNLFGENRDWDAIHNTILKSNADVIALQELNGEVSALIQDELIALYPYQIIDFQDSLISRFPITLAETTLTGSWGSPPKVYKIDFNEHEIMENTSTSIQFLREIMNAQQSSSPKKY